MRKTSMQRKREGRPWGYFEILSDKTDHRVKRILLYPGKRLSLQRHFHRNEHWYIISGEALVTRNKEEIRLNPGESVDIINEDLHRIANTGKEDLIFIEIQTGSYFGEDDIERIEDDFGRI